MSVINAVLNTRRVWCDSLNRPARTLPETAKCAECGATEHDPMRVGPELAPAICGPCSGQGCRDCGYSGEITVRLYH